MSSASVLSSPQQRWVPSANGLAAGGHRRLVAPTISRSTPVSRARWSRKAYISWNLKAGVDVQERERHPAGVEGLERQVEQHRRVLADRIQQDRTLEFGGGFPQDVDALGLQRAELVDEVGAQSIETVSRHFWPSTLGPATQVVP